MLHESVLTKEVIAFLKLSPNIHSIDCTVGGGGHAQAILRKTGPSGKLLGLDLDPKAVANARQKLRSFSSRVTLVQASFHQLEDIVHEFFQSIPIRAILFDLGMSSDQLEDKSLGFSFLTDAPLDMRRNRSGALTAAGLLNTWSAHRLASIFRSFGNLSHSESLGAAIVKTRKTKKFKTTTDLIQFLQNFPQSLAPRKLRINPATLVFQALRIAVNDEISMLRSSLPQALNILAKNGRCAIISYHSVEDRIVKQFFQTESKNCLCPKDFPVCVCHHAAKVKMITKKPIRPSEKEIQSNPRSRSALLRVCEKIQ